MLKETETEKTIGFFVTFLSLVLFQLVEAPPWLRLWAQSWHSLVFFSWNVFLLTVGGKQYLGGKQTRIALRGAGPVQNVSQLLSLQINSICQ